jgi:hypothetical protein
MSEQYKQAIAELESFYGGNVLNGGILEATWISEMQKLPIQQIQIGIARCFKKNPRKYNYFPAPDEILDLARGSMPAQNSQAYATADLSKPALPAAYICLKGLKGLSPRSSSTSEGGISPEEAEANKKEILIARLFLASKSFLSKEEISDFFPKMRGFSFDELDQMLRVAKSPVITKGKLPSAHSLAISTFESLAAQASNTILDDMRKYLRSGIEKYRQKAIDWATNNGYQLVKKGGQIVDIREVEF